MFVATFVQSSPYQQLEEQVYEWIGALRAANAVVTPDIVQEKAVKLRDALIERFKDSSSEEKKKVHYEDLEKFKGSSGWCQRFRSRWGLRFKKLAGEAASVNLEIAHEGQEDMKKIIEEYAPPDIFNWDEAACFWKAPPNMTLIVNPDERGTKRSKARVTVVFLSNMTGTEKRPLLVISTAKRPRCFGKIQAQNLPCKYANSQKGWMNGAIFTRFLQDFNADMKKQNRKVLVLVDGAGKLLFLAIPLLARACTG
jgi:DDE superfamily endonuclease/Tc5 transposase DNA-binding domain